MNAATLERIDRANQALYMLAALRSGGRVDVNAELTLVSGVHSSPVIANTTFRAPGVVSLAADEFLRRVTEHYRGLGHGFSLMTREHVDSDLETAADEAGWETVITLPGMVCRSPQQAMPTSVEATLTVVDPTVHLADFREALASGFTDDADEQQMLRSLFAKPESVQTPVSAVIARIGDNVCATGALYRHEDVGVVGFVATLPEYRRRGLGALVTTRLTEMAFEDGCTLTCLQASPMGFAVYQRLGYEVGTRYQIRTLKPVLSA